MPGFSLSRLERALAAMPPARRWWVGFSGGVDSSVLLHALSRLRPAGVELRALHVDHGLHPRSGQWREHCRRFAEARGIRFHAAAVDARPAPGQSPEAAARVARYGAFTTALAPGDLLLLAHHRDDQAETVLLRLLRGAGPEGLAGMPPVRRLGRGWLGRPLLGFTRAAIEAWARDEGLAWLDDPANRNDAFDRNFLRNDILPRLCGRWPAVNERLVRAAELQAEAAAVLAERAAADWDAIGGTETDRLPLAALEVLPPARRRPLLRHWIGTVNGLPLPDRRHLQRVLDEVVPARPDARPEVGWPGGRVRRFDGSLWLDGAGDPIDRTVVLPWDLRGTLRLPDGRLLLSQPRPGEGLRASLQARDDVRVAYRQGGERLRPAGRGGHRHRLKKLLQEWRVPPWERQRLPLLYVGDEIAAVPGYCVCEPFAAGHDETGLVITLQPGSRD